MITKIKNTKEKITLTLSAVKDFSWFFNTMQKTETRIKHGFVAYTCIIFFLGAMWSDAWDYCVEHEVVYKIIDLFKKVAL